MFWEISETLNVSLLSQQSYIRYKLATRQNAYVRGLVFIYNISIWSWVFGSKMPLEKAISMFFITNLYLVSWFES